MTTQVWTKFKVKTEIMGLKSAMYKCSLFMALT